MIRADTLNWNDYGGYTEMTALSLNVYSADEEESKCIIVHETLSQNCYSNKEESKQSIVNKTLSQNYSADVDKLCSTEIDKSEYNITEQKYEGSEVTYHVPDFNVSNVFECRRKNPDVSYEIAHMAIKGSAYFTDILDHLNGYQDRHIRILSSKNLKEAVPRVMEQEEEEIEPNINNITCNTSFQSPVTKNVQNKDAN